MTGQATTAASTRRAWTIVLAGSASFLVALDLLIVTTALDAIRLDLRTSITSLQWVLTAYGVTFACLLLTGAALGDRFGRRRMFAGGVALFAVGSAVAALSGSIAVLILGRIVEGIGGALILPVGLTVVTQAFPPERRGTAIGLLEGVSGLAVIAGPLLGGAIATWLSWQWIFWINVPFCVVILALAFVVLDESYGQDAALDGWGLGLATLAAFALIWGLVRGNEAGWTSAEVVVAFLVGMLAAVGFAVNERRAPAPMVPLGFFRSRAFSAGLAASFLLTASLYSSVFFAAQFFQVAVGTDPMGAGLRLVPWTATLLVVAPVTGLLADRVGDRPLLLVGLILRVVGLGWLALAAAPDVSYLAVLGPFLVAGVGCSMAIPVSQTVIVGAVPEDAVGKAAGVNNTFQELGGALGLAVTVAVFAATGTVAGPDSFVDGFGPARAAAAALAALGAVAALAVPRGRRSAAEPVPADPR
ncbi:MAG: drug resistance transporter, EmrB/QacA subfamily [Pseudonocardia sp.]|nr:drug resistance transporter, EmrB/QacA subfamily [Pseudonocardia sp.]